MKTHVQKLNKEVKWEGRRCVQGLEMDPSKSSLYFWHKNSQWQKTQFSIIEINIEIKTTTTAVIKNKLKYFPMSEGNTSIAEPNLEVLLPLLWFSKGLV